MASRRNPYNSGNVIQEDFEFYGRSDLVQQLSVPDSKAYFIKGNRRIGKTSLLRQIERNLIKDPTVVPVYLNLESVRNENNILPNFQWAIRRAFRQKGIEGFNCPNDFLQAFQASLEFIDKLGKKYYLLINEAEALLKLPQDIVLRFHQELIDTHDHLTVVVSATNQLENLELQKIDGLDLLDGFTTILLGCFSKEEARDLIHQTQHRDGPIAIEKTIEQDILKYAGTHPYLIQKMCFQLFEGEKLRAVKDHDYALDQSIRNFCAMDYDRLDLAKQQILQQFFGENPKTKAEINGFPMPTVSAGLKEMEQLGFLTLNDEYYALGNYFLAQWLLEQKPFIDNNLIEIKIKITMPPLNLFISYSHQDESFKKALDTHLTMLKRSDKIATWNDRAILAGTEWDQEIKDQLKQAHIILLLISPGFMASQYIWETELKLAMERHERKEASIVPIFIKDVVWKGAPFGKVQGLPRDAKPVAKAKNDKVWKEVAEGVGALVDHMLKNGVPGKTSGASTPPTPSSPSADPNPVTNTKKKLSPEEIQAICDLIDSDMEAAFEAMDKLEWGNRRGTYFDKKEEWVAPGIGFKRGDFRSQLKTLLKMAFE